MPELLERLRLSHGAVDVHGTPRRLAVMVQGLEAKQPDAVERSRGPPVKVRSGCSRLTANPGTVSVDSAGLREVPAAECECAPALPV